MKKESQKKTVRTVTGGNLNIRKDPEVTAQIIGVLGDGAKITVLEDLGEWLEIENGYVMKKWTK